LKKVRCHQNEEGKKIEQTKTVPLDRKTLNEEPCVRPRLGEGAKIKWREKEVRGRNPKNYGTSYKTMRCCITIKRLTADPIKDLGETLNNE